MDKAATIITTPHSLFIRQKDTEIERNVVNKSVSRVVNVNTRQI